MYNHLLDLDRDGKPDATERALEYMAWRASKKELAAFLGECMLDRTALTSLENGKDYAVVFIESAQADCLHFNVLSAIVYSIIVHGIAARILSRMCLSAPAAHLLVSIPSMVAKTLHP